MAEENPHLEVKKYTKPITNSRQVYYKENEKLILGRHGFIFRMDPTTQEKLEMLREEKNKINSFFNKSENMKGNLDFGKFASKNFIESYKSQTIDRNQLIKSKSQQDILS